MWSERPLLIPLTFLLLGCLAEQLLAIPVTPLIPLIVLGCLILSLPLKNRILFSCLLALFCASWGMASLAPRLDSSRVAAGVALFDGQQVTVEGIVQRRPTTQNEGQQLVLQVEQVLVAATAHQVAGVMLVTIGAGQGDWLSGDRIRFPAKLRVPKPLGLPGEFDYRRYLALRQIDATAWVADADRVVLMRGNARFSWYRWIDRMVRQSQTFIRQAVSSPEQRGILLALATGDQHEVPPELAAAYSRAGVSHILSVSGFHVGIVVAVWVFGMRWLLLRSEWLTLRIDLRRATLLSALPLMLFYLVFTGAAPATARSVLMLSAVVIAAWSEREVDCLDALLLAAGGLLVYDPGLLFDLSFQLSFLALWGLLVLTPLFVAPFNPLLRQGWQRSLLLFCAASLAAVLATAAPVLATFHQLSFVGILTNLLVVPLLGYGATVLATLAIPLLFVLPAVATAVLKLAGWLVQLSNLVVQHGAQLPVLRSFEAGPVDLLATVALLATLSFVVSVQRRIMVCSLLLSGLAVVHLWPAPANDGKLRLVFLSVGQGDATLIRLPDNKTMLVDGGGYLRDSGKDFGERYLVPALHHLKIRRIDVMVLSHPHPDHLGGLAAVAEQFPVGEFWQGSDPGLGPDYQRLMQALARQRTSLITVTEGDRPLQTTGYSVEVLAPKAGMSAAGGDNEHSVVLRLQHGQFSALLMGDAGLPVETTMIRQGIGTTTLLKLGHHGSRTASGTPFLAQVRPELAIVSAGAGNSFGLPAAETVERIRKQGSTLYRTDTQGSIQVVSDGSSYTATPLESEHPQLVAARRFILTVAHQLR